MVRAGEERRGKKKRRKGRCSQLNPAVRGRGSSKERLSGSKEQVSLVPERKGAHGKESLSKKLFSITQLSGQNAIYSLNPENPQVSWSQRTGKTTHLKNRAWNVGKAQLPSTRTCVCIFPISSLSPTPLGHLLNVLISPCVGSMPGPSFMPSLRHVGHNLPPAHWCPL